MSKKYSLLKSQVNDKNMEGQTVISYKANTLLDTSTYSNKVRNGTVSHITGMCFNSDFISYTRR